MKLELKAKTIIENGQEIKLIKVGPLFFETSESFFARGGVVEVYDGQKKHTHSYTPYSFAEAAPKKEAA